MSKKLLPFLQQKRKLLILVPFLFFYLLSFAQQKTVVTGIVYSSDSAPLPGVSVTVKGANNGTTTDTQGKFSIQVDKGATLVISFLGYQKKEITVNNAGNLGNIQMVSTTASLGQVVVVGYGAQNKRNLD